MGLIFLLEGGGGARFQDTRLALRSRDANDLCKKGKNRSTRTATYGISAEVIDEYNVWDCRPYFRNESDIK